MASHFEFQSTQLTGMMIIQRIPFEDERGSFARLYCAEEMREIGLEKPIVQINRSVNRSKGMVRGLHFQHPPSAEAKIVSCLKGKVFDVAVDLRHGSKTFLHWHGEMLSADNKAIFIPEGFAHGFQVLEPDSELLYLHTAAYVPEMEGGVRYDDPIIGIDWPLPSDVLSERDRRHPLLTDGFQGLEI